MKTPTIALLFALALTGCAAPPKPQPVNPPAATGPSPVEHRLKGVIIATDYPDLNAAVDALPLGGGVVFLPPGTYRLKKPLNLADTYNSAKTRWITLQGSGQLNTTITGDFPDQPLVDATRAGYLTVRDLSLSGRCKTLWLSARREGGGGGGSTFQNVGFGGGNAPVTIWLIASECNRFYNCEITNNRTNGICVAFVPQPSFSVNGVTYEIASPYTANDQTGNSTTTLHFYGSFIHSFGYNSIGLFAQGSTADIAIHGGYNCNQGFASIYLDGTKGNVGDSLFQALRIEGESGLYCLYAKGAVRNVTIDSGNWGSEGEVIRFADEHKRFDDAGASWADGWTIHNTSFVLADYSIPEPHTTGASYQEPPGGRMVIHLDRMKNCRIENIWNVNFKIVRTAQTPPKDELRWFTAKLLICDKSCESSTIIAKQASDVSLPADTRATRLEALADDGGQVRRTYLGAGGSADLLNLSPIDVRTIKHPRTGDLAMDNGALRGDGQPRLVWFNGKEWVFPKTSGERQP